MKTYFLFFAIVVASLQANSEFLYGTKEDPRWILGETDEARVFEMSDYSCVFMMGNHFYQCQRLIHLKDCPGCASLTSCENPNDLIGDLPN